MIVAVNWEKTEKFIYEKHIYFTEINLYLNITNRNKILFLANKSFYLFLLIINKIYFTKMYISSSIKFFHN